MSVWEELKEKIEHLDYLNLEVDYHEKLSEIQRDEFGRYLSSSAIVEGVRVGWYQDSKGGLFHYDGIVWDIVPDAKVQELEYLGA
jgi:hypothetical protein